MGQNNGQEDTKMSRRGENIRKRKDGRWEGRYYIIEPQSGRTITRSVYAKTYSEVKEKLSSAKVLAESAVEETISDQEICFAVAAKEWFILIEGSKKRTTYMKYYSVYQKYIKKKVDLIPFSGLNEEILAGVFQREGTEPFSESLQKSISCVLNQILSYAARQYHIPVFSYTYQRQKSGKKPIEVLNLAEQTKLLQYLYQEMDIEKLGILLCISTGLRLGEICSLKWGDIDLTGKVLYVNTTAQRITIDNGKTKTVLIEGEPKSIFSKRAIPLSEEMVKLLKQYCHTAERYVLCKDKPMEPRTYQNKFQKYLRLAGIERKNFHILRHTFATNCVSSGMDIKSLSEILGHSDVKITLNRYVHPTIETKRQYMNSLSVIYGQYLGQI